MLYIIIKTTATSVQFESKDNCPQWCFKVKPLTVHNHLICYTKRLQSPPVFQQLLPILVILPQQCCRGQRKLTSIGAALWRPQWPRKTFKWSICWWIFTVVGLSTLGGDQLSPEGSFKSSFIKESVEAAGELWSQQLPALHSTTWPNSSYGSAPIPSCSTSLTAGAHLPLVWDQDKDKGEESIVFTCTPLISLFCVCV